MIETSFGKLDILLKQDKKILAEYLEFTSEGRNHKHPEYEYFFVLSGSGQIQVGTEIFDVEPGSLVTIPPMTDHWMIPSKEAPMTGLLWYHQLKLSVEN